MSRKIGVYGGTFNPIHNAVLSVANKALEHGLEKIIFVPNGNPPHKKVGVLDKEHRFEMVAAAVAGNDKFEASRIEVDRAGETWSIDTLGELKKQYGDDVELYFIIGEDNVAAFEKYDRRADFFKLAAILVAPRKTASQSNLEAWRKALPEATIDIIDCDASGLSATEIRQLVADGKSIDSHVPAAVAKLIAERGHYKVETKAA